MNRDFNLISIIVPMHNEEQMLETFFEKIIFILKQINKPFEIVCVNDGSSDTTLEKLQNFQKNISEIVIIDFHKNFGKEAALTAGIEYAQGDILVPIDADLQDPPSLLFDMIEKWREGFDEVLAVRRSRKADTMVKRKSSGLFYKIFNKIAEHKIPSNAGDFRLIDRNIAEVALKLSERNRFMKGILSWASNGNTAVIEYKRETRQEGQSKWNYWKLWNFAIDGIIAFSSWPLRIWSYIGVLISSVSMLYMLYIFVKTLIMPSAHPAGYPSLMCVMLFLGGIQLISLGIMGEYISRIYNETKNRPMYVVKNVYRNSSF